MFKAKFKVHSITKVGGNYVEVKMMAAVGDNDFTEYTPTGEMRFICSNSEVNKQVKPGKVFTITFTEDVGQL
ncbi:hypothetical protein ACFPYJ_15010 [Paenibacillus solisilvae]|uniref:Uncharacterized protein n=1 Tax=Paenibacillus solisilvae TaxID=2486751 RepID=A0ABW0W0Z2_9BACL